MTTQIHGHEVIGMMLDSGQVFTRDSLLMAITGRFGADARYCTCSVANMEAGELIDFLAQRGKFADVAGGFVINPDKVCQH
jgi:probable metal-binding protein